MGLRARTNIAISCCLLLTGKPDMRWKRSSAQPFELVGCSAGMGEVLLLRRKLQRLLVDAPCLAETTLRNP